MEASKIHRSPKLEALGPDFTPIIRRGKLEETTITEAPSRCVRSDQFEEEDIEEADTSE